MPSLARPACSRARCGHDCEVRARRLSVSYSGGWCCVVGRSNRPCFAGAMESSEPYGSSDCRCACKVLFLPSLRSGNGLRSWMPTAGLDNTPQSVLAPILAPDWALDKWVRAWLQSQQERSSTFPPQNPRALPVHVQRGDDVNLVGTWRCGVRNAGGRALVRVFENEFQILSRQSGMEDVGRPSQITSGLIDF